MSTVNFPEGTKVTIDGKEYTTQTGVNLNDGTENRQTTDGIRRFNAEGQELDENGEVAKTGKTSSKK